MATAEKVNPWLDEGSRYDEQEGGGQRQKINDLKFLDNTSHTVRILPSKKLKELPFYGYKQHWIPQNASTTGKPITHGIDERCPVCEWISAQWDEVHRLKEEHDMTDKSPEVETLLKKISAVSAKTAYDMNVIHRENPYVKDEETGEQVFAPKRMRAGYTVYKEIFSFAKKWGSPSNEETGYDLEIKTTGQKDRREYQIIPDRNASPLTVEEKGLISKCYDLKEFRKPSKKDDIIKILENAKSPYNDIVSYIENYTPKTEKKDDVEAVEKEIDETVKENQVKEDKNQQEQDKSEISSNVEKEAENPDINVDEDNLENYECKGDYDDNDKACSDCPVKQKCENVHSFYVKAKTLGIDTDPHKSTAKIIEEVEKSEKTEKTEKIEEPQTSRRGKKIPF